MDKVDEVVGWDEMDRRVASFLGKVSLEALGSAKAAAVAAEFRAAAVAAISEHFVVDLLCWRECTRALFGVDRMDEVVDWNGMDERVQSVLAKVSRKTPAPAKAAAVAAEFRAAKVAAISEHFVVDLLCWKGGKDALSGEQGAGAEEGAVNLEGAKECVRDAVSAETPGDTPGPTGAQPSRSRKSGISERGNVGRHGGDI